LQPSKRSSDVLTSIWRTRGPAALALWPFGLLFALLSRLRRAAYQLGLLATVHLPVPVVVVGNIIAGGAGKTPLTLWLAIQLSAAGRKPGIVSRGYGGKSSTAKKVGAGDTAADVGDEPLLLARRASCPVYVGVDRAAAAQALLAENPDCDLILCDDGLQHYRLARTVEIAVIDRRGSMNGWPLPAGPLREPVSRLLSVDAIVLNGNAIAPIADVPVFRMHLEGRRFYRLEDPGITCSARDLAGRKLHAVAGIGEPQRFFDHLAVLGLDFEAHAFPDHHRYTRADFALAGDAILMTEKDALKCAGLTPLPIWVLPVAARIEPDLARFVLEKIDGPASA
jgi:tetraacyldisaccharide 4'-kinase